MVTYPKPADWCIDTLCERLGMLQNVMCDSGTILSRVDHHPATRLGTQNLKQRAHAGLQRFLLVALLAVATSRGCGLGREIEKEGEVRRGEADVGRAAPREREALGGGERDAGERVPVAEHGGPRREVRLERAGGFPSVRGEEEVDRAVV
jgi:hypothetical protein